MCFFNCVVDLVIPVCNADLRPYVGQKFSTLEDAISFYENYARVACFDTRRHGKKTNGGEITWQYVVCNREGQHVPEVEDLENIQQVENIEEAEDTDEEEDIEEEQNIQEVSSKEKKKERKHGSRRCGCDARITFKFCLDGGVIQYVVHHFIEGHNHPMVEKQHKRFMKGNRKMNEVHHKFVEDCTKANIGPTSTFNLLKEFFSGYDSVGCTLNDVRNCSRDIKEKLKVVDVQMILNQMHDKKQNCEGFFL